MPEAAIFAPDGRLVPLALRAVRKGGRVVYAGIHMSDIPSLPYSALLGERSIQSVANLTREDGRAFLKIAARPPIRTSVKLSSRNHGHQPEAGLFTRAWLAAEHRQPSYRLPTPSVPTARNAPQNDLDERLCGLSTLLVTLAGSVKELRLDLCEGPVPLHADPKSLELAILEGVSQLRRQMAGPGAIIVRTRRVGHGVFLLIAAREYADAVFRFGGWRTQTRPCAAEMFIAARRLAHQSHGRCRMRDGSILVLRLPTILRLNAGKRPASAVPFPPAPAKETDHENRQPVAA